MWPQNRKTDLDTHQKLGFGFGSVSPKKRGFGFGFKTDPGLFKCAFLECAWYEDGAGNTVEENSSVFSLIRMR